MKFNQTRLNDMSLSIPSPDTDQSPPRSPRQTRSFEDSPFHAGLDGARDYSPAFQSTSLRTPSKVSRGLLAKVSRFETLDALSVPFTPLPPQLHLSPLQTHQLRRQSSFVKTNTVIFERTNIPASVNQIPPHNSKEREVISISEINQEDGAFDAFDASALQATLENIKSRIEDTTIEVSYKPASIRLKQGGQIHQISTKGALVGNLSLSRIQTPRRGLTIGSSSNIVRERPISRVAGLPGISPQRKAYDVYRDSFDSSIEMSKITTINTYNNGKEHQNGTHTLHKDSTFDNVTIKPQDTTPDETQTRSPIAKHTFNKIETPSQRPPDYRRDNRPLSPHARSLGTLRALVTRCTSSHDRPQQRDTPKVETVSRDMTALSSLRKVSSIRDLFQEGETSVPKVTATALKDKIDFFDGAISRVASTVARPSLANAIPPITPVYHRTSTASRRANTPSATGTVRRLSAAVNPKPMTPTRTFRAISQSITHRKQNLVFGSPAKNPFESPVSVRKTSIASISPTSRKVSSVMRLSPAASVGSQGSPPKGVQDFRSSMTQIREASSETVRNQTWWDNKNRAQQDTISSLSKRRISDKLDKFVQAESVRRIQEAAKEEHKPATDLLTQSKESAPSANRGVVANLRRSFESQRSKVTDMKRMFDGSNSARPSIAPVADEVPRQPASMPQNNSSPHSKSTPQKKKNSPLKNNTPSHQPSPTRLLVFPPRYSTSVKAKSTTANIVDQSPKPSIASKTQTKESPSRLAPTVTSKPPTKSKTIGERMKLFEKSTIEEPKVQESKRRAFGRKINRSLKSLFESHSSPGKSEDTIANAKPTKHATWGGKEAKYPCKENAKSKGGMNGKQVMEVMNEFQDYMPARLSPTRKTGTYRGVKGVGTRWVQMGKDGTQSREPTLKSLDISSTEGSEHEMIVKEVECGLKHPRPMRGTEMKSMMALCREKVGSVRHKEKEKIAAKTGAKAFD